MNNCFLIILLFFLYVNQPCDGVPLITKNNLTFLLNYQWHPVAQQLPKYNVMIRYEACVNKYFLKYSSSQICPPNNLLNNINDLCRCTNDMPFEYYPWLVDSRSSVGEILLRRVHEELDCIKRELEGYVGARQNDDTSPMETHPLRHLLCSAAHYHTCSRIHRFLTVSWL